MKENDDNLDARLWVNKYADDLYSYAFKRVKDEEMGA